VKPAKAETPARQGYESISEEICFSIKIASFLSE